jgi:hypothetical protein
MDGQKSQAKLTRTQSSLLRSSPTIRSSIHSLSSVNEEDAITPHQQDSEEEKLVKKPRKSGSTPRTGSTRFTSPVLAMAMLCVFTLFSLLFFLYLLYLRNEETPTSENLLLALIFIAVALLLASKHKGLIHQTLLVLKHSWDESAKRLGLSRTNSKPVQWFIGEPSEQKARQRSNKKIIREGVEFYSNGDFYEGEFHKGEFLGTFLF